VAIELQIHHVDIELKNYRCFPRERPARFTIGRQFTGFVGINNAASRPCCASSTNFGTFAWLNSPGHDFMNLLRGATQTVNFPGVADPAEVLSNQNDGRLEARFEIFFGEPEGVSLGEEQLPVPSSLTVMIERATNSMTLEAEGIELDSSVQTNWHGRTFVQSGVATWEFGPWMTLFDKLQRSVFIPAFRNAVNSGASSHYDLNIGSAFIGEWDQYKSGPNKSNNQAALGLRAEIQRIFAFDELDINASAANDTLQVIIDGKSYRLEEIGGGIAHFIIVLAYAATRRSPFVFIDEPELNLHPTLQVDFLTTLANYTEEGVAFATHSIGLARAAAEVVYSVRRIRSGESEVAELEGTPRLAEFLGELSLSGYQELGFDRVLLVEGATDVKVYQRLLRRYGVEHKAVLLPLGGSTMIRASAADELAEVKRLTQQVFAVIDSERSAAEGELPPERQAFLKACEDANVACMVLERRAIENYFSDRAVKATLGDKYRALQPYEALRDAELSWNKNDNWRIAGEMDRAEIEGTDLGDFLDSFAA
jgi:predicted ATPase